MLPQSWISDSLKLYTIFVEVIKYIEKTMKHWKVVMTEEGKCLAEIIIQRGISQEDALSLLPIVIAMMHSIKYLGNA